MATLTSPVNAPWSSQWTSCPAPATFVPRQAAATAASAVKGGAMTISAWLASAASGRNASVKATASAIVLCIFQLAARSGVRMVSDQDGAFGRTATPGNVRPARNSSDAPPPVEMWEI